MKARIPTPTRCPPNPASHPNSGLGYARAARPEPPDTRSTSSVGLPAEQVVDLVEECAGFVEASGDGDRVVGFGYLVG